MTTLKLTDEFTLEEVMTGLRCIGGLAEQARRAGRSLKGPERDLMLSVRAAADKYSLSVNMQTAIEQEGAEVVREALR